MAYLLRLVLLSPLKLLCVYPCSYSVVFSCGNRRLPSSDQSCTMSFDLVASLIRESVQVLLYPVLLEDTCRVDYTVIGM